MVALFPDMNSVDLSARLLDRNARLQFTDRLVNAHPRRRRDDLRRGIHSQHSIGGRFGGVEIHDCAKCRQLWVKGFGEDRANRRRLSINGDGATDHARIALKQIHESAVGNRERLWIGIGGQRAEHRLRAGHVPAKTAVGINSHGYVAETSEQAADQFFPSYASAMNAIGRERGWSTISRPDFEALRSPRGALLVGSPDEVADKILFQHRIFRQERFLLQMTVGAMPLWSARSDRCSRKLRARASR